MNITVVYPVRSHRAYKIAAEAFAELAMRTARTRSQIITDGEYAKSEGSESLSVLLGNDAVNSITSELYLTGQIDSLGIRYCTDDYRIRATELQADVAAIRQRYFNTPLSEMRRQTPSYSETFLPAAQ